jgi:N2,N2-dimethylguanosine tRNA methyltransferase
MLAKIFLRPKEEVEIRQGFPWVFDNEIAYIKENKDGGKIPLAESSVADGCAVNVFSSSGQYEGTGILNKKSKIAVRFLAKDSSSTGVFDRAFFEKKIGDALSLRAPFFASEDSCRLIFGEADFLPGLIVERYVDIQNRVYLVVQFLALCTEIYRDIIIDILNETCRPFGIYERSDANIRLKEGLPLRAGWISDERSGVITIRENGVLLNVDIAAGQKTGYFLDQKFNRQRAALLAKNREVLDTFTHTGAFGLNAVAGGAKSVTAVDISEDAVKTVKENIALNKAESRMNVIQADVFDILKEYEQNGRSFDMIILDPPAFAKNAKALDKAYGGYKEINLRAMKILRSGGILISCSCSQFMDSALFYSMLTHAASDAKRTVQIAEKRGAGPDHPVPLGYPKAEYLTCAICRVL